MRYKAKNTFILCLMCVAHVGANNFHFRARSSLQRILPSCPDEAKFLPCKCKMVDLQLYISCKNSESTRIQKALDLLRDLRSPITELHLVANRIMELPARFLGPLQVNSLYLVNNELIGISRNAFAGLESSLQYLYINEPLLQKLPLDTFDNLRVVQEIIMENSMISDMPNLSYLSRLEILKILHSKLNQIPKASHQVLENLHEIQISNSQVEVLQENILEDCIFLESVDFSNNIISWVHPRAFIRLERVTVLNLSGNHFSDAATAVMAAREIRSLESVNLSRNKITRVKKGSFVDMQRLHTINLSGNGLNQIDQEAFYRLPSLKSLDLSYNRLLFFDPDIFTGVQGLEHLNLSNNLLAYVVDIKFISISLPNLRIFDLSSNALTQENVFLFSGHPKLEILNIEQNKLTTLPPNFLKELPNLRNLNLGGNQIHIEHSENIWDLPKLKYLDLSHNKLTSIDSKILDGLPLLTNFDASFNQITSMGSKAFENTQLLVNLNISSNEISTVHRNTLSNLKNLNALDFSSNALTTLDNNMLKGLTTLRILKICCNQISTIHKDAFRDNLELNTLDLSYNLFKKLPSASFTHFNTLRNLNLKSNGIVSIPNGALAYMRTIESLDLSKNHIQTINGRAFHHMNLLKTLDFSSNFVQTLPNNVFSKMDQLSHLNISNNFLTFLNNQHFMQTTHLRVLDLSNNSLTKLQTPFEKLQMLEDLNMNDNYINKLGPSIFRNLKKLQKLRFAQNGLQNLESNTFHKLSLLTSLMLHDNNIVEVVKHTFNNLSNIEEIDLSKNQITLIDNNAFFMLPSLRILSLQDNVVNHIAEDAFHELSSIKLLNISHNDLQDVPKTALNKLPTLDVLDISKNYLMEVIDGAFENLHWLTVLLINENDLCLLSKNAFRGPKNLKVLMLQDNQLKSLHLNALRDPIESLSLLDMSGNPFECDCQMVWLREYIEQEEERRVARLQNVLTHFDSNSLNQNPPESILEAFASPLKKEPVCAGPHKYAGMPITRVPPEAFLCNSMNEIATGKSRCLPRFFNRLIAEAEKNGTKFPAEVLRLLHNLRNETQDEMSKISRGELMKYLNTFSAENQVKTNIQKEKPIITEQVQAADLIVNNAKDFVTGDTPTIYAGALQSSKTKSPEIQHSNKDSGGLFGFQLPSLPNIFDSLTNKLPNMGLNLKLGGLPFGRKNTMYDTHIIPKIQNKTHQPSWVEISTQQTVPKSSSRLPVQSTLSEWMKNYYTENKELLDISLVRPLVYSENSTNNVNSLPSPLETLGPGPESGTPFLPALSDSQFPVTSSPRFDVTQSQKYSSIDEEDLRGIPPSHNPNKFHWDWSSGHPPDLEVIDPFVVIDKPNLFYINANTTQSAITTAQYPNNKIEIANPTVYPNETPFMEEIREIFKDSPLFKEENFPEGDQRPVKDSWNFTQKTFILEEMEDLSTPLPVMPTQRYQEIRIANPQESSSDSMVSDIPQSDNASTIESNTKKTNHTDLTNTQKFISPSRAVSSKGVSKIQKITTEYVSATTPASQTTTDRQSIASALAKPIDPSKEGNDWYFKSYFQEYDPEGPVGGNGPPPNFSCGYTPNIFYHSILFLLLQLLL